MWVCFKYIVKHEVDFELVNANTCDCPRTNSYVYEQHALYKNLVVCDSRIRWLFGTSLSSRHLSTFKISVEVWAPLSTNARMQRLPWLIGPVWVRLNEAWFWCIVSLLLALMMVDLGQLLQITLHSTQDEAQNRAVSIELYSTVSINRHRVWSG